MNLGEYINTIYNGDSKWFVEELSRQWHNERIMNILNIKQYLNGKHPILDRPDETYNGRIFKTRKIILQYAKVLLNFETSFLLKTLSPYLVMILIHCKLSRTYTKQENTMILILSY